MTTISPNLENGLKNHALFRCGAHIWLNHLYIIFSDSSADDGDLQLTQESQHLPLEEAFGDEVSGDAVPAPAPLPQRAPAPVVEPNTDHMSAVEELVEALARPFTVSNPSFNNVCRAYNFPNSKQCQFSGLHYLLYTSISTFVCAK